MRYDYFCPANQKTYEVNHGMSEALQTWGELCSRLDIDTGEIPAESPIERVISGGELALARRVSRDTSAFEPTRSECVPRPCCGPGSKCSH